MKMPPVLCCIVFLFVSMLSAVARQQEKPRVIVTTDGEIDDQSSMIRFLMYSSDYDVAGIVQVNGVQKDGHSKDKWIESQIAKYAECLPNLRKHNPDYPDAEYLLSVLAVGNENREDLHKLPPLLSDSEGAQLIIRTLLDSDPRPVHILAWGGANTQANALWQIKQKYSAAEWAKAVSKARLYCIWYQDGGGKWIEQNRTRKFIDTDDFIVEHQKCSINDIFAEHGEEYFRNLETDCLRELISEKISATVISVGGGLPLREENGRLLRELGMVVYLRARVDTLVKRLSHDKTRPLLAGGNVEQKITELMQRRADIYEKRADIIIDTDDGSFEKMFERIAHYENTCN